MKVYCALFLLGFAGGCVQETVCKNGATFDDETGRCELRDGGTLDAPMDAGNETSVPDAPASDIDIAIDGLDAGPSMMVSDVAVGRAHICVLVDGAVYCRGNNGNGQLGDGTQNPVVGWAKPVLPGDVLEISGVADTVCALVPPHQLHCWGKNDRGQVGTDLAALVPSPTFVGTRTDLPQWVGVSVGVNATCALRLQGGHTRVECWGANDKGQAGLDSGTADVREPSGYVNLASAPTTQLYYASRVTVGVGYACALGDAFGGVAGPSVYCWGDSSGERYVSEVGSPWLASRLEIFGARDVSVTHTHACSTRMTGLASCWGSNGSWESISDNVLTTGPADSELNVRQVVAGQDYTCGIDEMVQVLCVGANERGQLGRGTMDAVPQKTPRRVLLPGVPQSLYVNASGTTCALNTNGSLFCWGERYGPTPIRISVDDLPLDDP